MNFLLWSACLVGLIVSCQGEVLNEENFDTKTKDFNYFVTFVNTDTKHVDQFLSFWTKISNLYTDPSETTRIGIVHCKDNENLCKSHNVEEALKLKYFPLPNDSSDWKPIFDFLTEMIQKALVKITERMAMFKGISEGNSFVKFTYPNCPYCVNATIIWEKLEKAHENEERFSLLSVCCKNDASICERFGVTRYPTILYIKDGEKIKQFAGMKTLNNLEEFISDNLPVPKATTKTPMIAGEKVKPIELTAEIFDNVLKEGYTFVLYFLKKCKYCQGIPEKFDKLAEYYADSDKIKIATLDCNRQTKICLQNSKGCPTLSLYNNGKRIVRDYTRDNSFEALVSLIEAYTTDGEALEQWKEREKQLYFEAQ